MKAYVQNEVNSVNWFHTVIADAEDTDLRSNSLLDY